MTQRTFICGLFLALAFAISKPTTAGQSGFENGPELHKQIEKSAAGTQPSSKIPMTAGQPHEAPHGHGKSARVPHMEELPHIHRYHKERVRKLRTHQGKCWILFKALVVLCHLSLLWIAYMHLTH
jgi:hypothetical protein